MNDTRKFDSSVQSCDPRESIITLDAVPPNEGAEIKHLIIDDNNRELGYVIQSKYDTCYLDKNLSHVLGTYQLGNLEQTKKRLENWLWRGENREKLYASLTERVNLEPWMENPANNNNRKGD